jgi:hypothetical protein
VAKLHPHARGSPRHAIVVTKDWFMASHLVRCGRHASAGEQYMYLRLLGPLLRKLCANLKIAALCCAYGAAVVCLLGTCSPMPGRRLHLAEVCAAVRFGGLGLLAAAPLPCVPRPFRLDGAELCARLCAGWLDGFDASLLCWQ